MERNIRLYPLYQAFWNALFWMPVFFLLFASVLTPAEVLRLEAIYYLAVVLFEVPSGYLSDRVGRRVTLLIATACWTGAGVVFALADSFGTFVVAQILLAGGMAFNSGTDTSLLYDSLAVLGRHDEMAQVESRAASAGLYAGSIAALFGGLAGMFSLRLGYVLSSLAATGAMLVVWRFGEPPAGDAQVLPPASQVVDCLRRLRNPALAWLFLFAVAMTVFDHVPYEFAQPWLGFLIVSAGGSARLTPMSSGVIVAVVALLGALAAGRAVWLRSRLGIRPALMVLMLLQVGVMATLGQWIHPLVLIALALRGVPDAVAGPIRN
ncbi:MAG: MFS transporter, partial [Planctomycetota bacterium]